MNKLIKSLLKVVSSIKDPKAQKEVLKSIVTATKSGEVNKTLDSSTLSLIDQVASLINQISQMTSGEVADVPVVEEEGGEDEDEEVGKEANNVDGEEEDEDEEVGKEANNVDGAEPGNPSNGSSSADEILEDGLSEEDKKAIQAIGKALGLKLPKKRKAEKSFDAGSNILASAIQNLTNVVGQIKKSQDDQSNVIEGLLDATGITSQLEVIEKSTKKKGVAKGNDENLSILKSINNNLEALGNGGSLRKGEYTRVGNSLSQETRKDLGGVAGLLLDPSIKSDPSLRR